MSFIAQPAANLHSPGAIGDVTPDTIKATTVQTGNGGIQIGNAGFIQAYGADDNNFLILNQGAGTPEGISIGQADNTNTALVPNGTELGIKLGDKSAYAKIVALKPRFTGIPTSASGLSSGDVYSNAGILTIVP